jgi:hypothetical protein
MKVILRADQRIASNKGLRAVEGKKPQKGS